MIRPLGQQQQTNVQYADPAASDVNYWSPNAQGVSGTTGGGLVNNGYQGDPYALPNSGPNAQGVSGTTAGGLTNTAYTRDQRESNAARWGTAESTVRDPRYFQAPQSPGSIRNSPGSHWQTAQGAGQAADPLFFSPGGQMPTSGESARPAPMHLPNAYRTPGSEGWVTAGGQSVNRG